MIVVGGWKEGRDLLTPRDRLLWEMVCRTTVPLRGGHRSLVCKDSRSADNGTRKVMPVSPFSRKSQRGAAMARGRKGTISQEGGPRSFDYRVYRKLAEGYYPIEARLDLHGLMQEEAYRSLKEFLQSSQHRGLRYVMVITGKGCSHGSDGVLCRFVPCWLSTPVFRYYVHTFEQAARRHGGGGALYIRLRCL